MVILLFCIGLLQCFLIWTLGQAGYRIEEKAIRDHQLAARVPPDGWPPCALIVPVAGAHPSMEPALRSLATQNYPQYKMFLVTTRDDQAVNLIGRLAQEYGNIVPVLAPKADKCGQKNLNLLEGIRAAGDYPQIYAFCDSTHIAGSDFLRCLAGPIARGKCAFTAGYHEVEPQDQGIVSLSYALCVLFMRFMQSLPSLTQPWGGAMAMSREAFWQMDIAELWSTNVVDDCSLAAYLAKKGERIRFCAGALLRTWTSNHPYAIWRAWMERQILFLKFCMPGQWLQLGLACLVMIAPPVWAIIACGRGILGIGGGADPFLALCWFCAVSMFIGGWRKFLPTQTAISRWITAFFCSCFMFALVYAGTLFTHTLLWHNTIYRVGRGGRVISIERQ